MRDIYARKILTVDGKTYTPAYPVMLVSDAGVAEDEVFAWLYLSPTGFLVLRDRDVTFDIGKDEEFNLDDIIEAFGSDAIMDILITDNFYGLDMVR